MGQDDGVPDRLPFHAPGEPFATQAFEEACARLLFLSEQRWPAGWLFGPSGVGKSALLKTVQRELRRTGSEAILLSVCGLDGDDFWPTIASLLGGRETAGRLAARKVVRALLVAASMINRPVTILLDDADRGGEDLWDQIATLVRMADSVTPNHTVVVATAGELPTGDLGRRIDLRADLPPFTADETAEYVAHRTKAASATVSFDSKATAELFAATGGVPAAIGRLADLALIAASAGGDEIVTAELVRSAASELRPNGETSLVAMTAPEPTRLSA